MTQRVIKFRAWHNEAKAMLQVGDNHGTTHPLDCALYARHGQDVVLMLWTGLLDKHGKEIYEHDIVRILYTDWPSKSSDDPRTLDEYMRDIAAIRIVIWSVNGFYLSTSINGYAESIEPGRHGYIEKIGDLYTTPELVDPKMIER